MTTSGEYKAKLAKRPKYVLSTYLLYSRGTYRRAECHCNAQQKKGTRKMIALRAVRFDGKIALSLV